jgi:hypothetical protein
LASFTEKNSFLSLKPKQKIFSLFDKTLIIQGCKAKELFGLYVALFGADKKSLFLLQGEEGMLYKLSLDSLKVERMLALNCRAENFVESEDKLLVALYYPPERKQGTLILDKESLRPTGWLPCRDHFYLIASSNFKYAYAIKDHGHKISIINPVDNFESNDISLSSLNIPFPMKNPVISPDSKFIYYLTNDAVYKLRILHNKLLFAGKVTEPLDTVKEYPAFFNSSALWPSSNHKNAYENNKNLLKAISLDLLSFDKKNKQIYYSGRIYSDDGVLIKDFIKTTTPIKTKLSPNRRFLFLGKISSVFIVDINPTPENIKREM